MTVPYTARRRRASFGSVATFTLAMFAAAACVPTAARAANPRIDETTLTPAAVMSVDHHRQAAETGGDTAKPDARQVADYRSITQVHAPDRDRHANETALTPQAVIAVDDHWSLAELRGDTEWLRSLLLADYRSVRADGSAWDKETLLALASKNRGHGSKKIEAFDTWLKTHPMNESVIIHGDVAILVLSDPKTGHVRLSNVFVHQKGRWLAMYSQLTKIK